MNKLGIVGLLSALVVGAVGYIVTDLSKPDQVLMQIPCPVVDSDNPIHSLYRKFRGQVYMVKKPLDSKNAWCYFLLPKMEAEQRRFIGDKEQLKDSFLIEDPKNLDPKSLKSLCCTCPTPGPCGQDTFCKKVKCSE